MVQVRFTENKGEKLVFIEAGVCLMQGVRLIWGPLVTGFTEYDSDDNNNNNNNNNKRITVQAISIVIGALGIITRGVGNWLGHLGMPYNMELYSRFAC